MQGVTAAQFVIAVQSGDLELVRRCILTRQEIIQREHQFLESGIINAVMSNQIKVVELMIKSGINFRFRSETPLKLALEHGHVDIARLLVKYGASLHQVTAVSLHLAIISGHLSTVQFFVDFPAMRDHFDGKAMELACQQGRSEIVMCLLKHGAPYKHCLNLHFDAEIQEMLNSHAAKFLPTINEDDEFDGCYSGIITGNDCDSEKA